jgi:ribosomal protein S18 acetylase RimI-like enzyme
MHRVLRLDQSFEAVARAIHAVQIAAYTREAALLGVSNFPPLHRTVQDIARSGETYCGVYEGQVLVGALGFSSGSGGHGLNIDSLVVSPGHQRRGVARTLLAEFVTQHGTQELTVQTGAKNAPALTLYACFGFKEFKRCVLGEEQLELVQLRRESPHASGVA